jgi:hypothetical protein
VVDQKQPSFFEFSKNARVDMFPTFKITQSATVVLLLQALDLLFEAITNLLLVLELVPSCFLPCCKLIL